MEYVLYLFCGLRGGRTLRRERRRTEREREEREREGMKKGGEEGRGGRERHTNRKEERMTESG